MKEFGKRVRTQRQAMGLTREEFCGDETELSVRQLARIEAGTSLPTLNKVYYIAKQLGVAIGDLTDGADLELPERYKELKYLILRVPTYADEERLKIREEQFDEIYLNYYDNLPEDEQLIVDCMQAKLDVNITDNVDFGVGLLNDYFEQIMLKKVYSLNDLIIIHLYLACFNKIGKETTIFKYDTYNNLLDKLFNQVNSLQIEDLFLLNNVLLSAFYGSFQRKEGEKMQKIIQLSHEIMVKGQDYQKMPITCLLEWKYQLFCLENVSAAEELYYKAILFSKMISDAYLEKAIEAEWEKDYSNKVDKIN